MPANSSNQVEPERHNNLTSRRSVRKVSILSQQVKLTDRSWPFIGSFALHALLFALLTCPLLQYSASVDANALTVIWLPLNFSPSDPAKTSPAFQREYPADESPAEPEQSRDSFQSVAADITTPFAPAPPAVQETSAAAADDSIDAVVTSIIPPTPRPVAAPGKTNESTRIPVRSEPYPQATTVHHAAMPLEPEPETQHAALQSLRQEQLELPVSRQSMAATDPAVRRNDAGQMSRQRSEQKQLTAVKPETKPLLQRDTSPTTKVQSAAVAKPEQAAVTTASKRQDKPAVKTLAQNSSNKRTEQLPAKPKEMALPIIKGDVKLVAVGSTQIITTITFKEFAQSRRDRPFSRAETKQKKSIVPRVASTKVDTVEVVIEQSSPGVYTFTVEPVRSQVNVVFTLKLHDGTSRKITKELGKLALSRKTVLCKLLMPDGILWDDDKEFSGNMEDSESTTKFNATTGLMWKEYAD